MGLKNTRAGNYPEWYQNVVSEADMAENSSSPGCMVIKPWGYGIWERIRDVFDEKIKETEHENCYFPMFIPLSFFQKEAEHVDGFAKEMAVVTHSRLSMKDGKLTPDSKLEEPLIVRPQKRLLPTLFPNGLSLTATCRCWLTSGPTWYVGKCVPACF